MLVSTGGLDTSVLIWDRLSVPEIDEPGKKQFMQRCLFEPFLLPYAVSALVSNYLLIYLFLFEHQSPIMCFKACIYAPT